MRGARATADPQVGVTMWAPAARLSTLDRFLPVWTGLAMVIGLVLGRWVPGLPRALDAVQIDSTRALPVIN